MAKKRITRDAQYPLVASFEFDITDTMVNASGVEIPFLTDAGVFDAINLPQGSTVIGGAITVVTVSNETGTATLAVGDSATAARYLAATNIKAAVRTALVPTGFRNANGLPIRITLANQNGDATAGTVRIEVQYIIKDRANETQTH